MTDYAVEVNGQLGRDGVTCTYVKQRDEVPPVFTAKLIKLGLDAFKLEFESEADENNLTDGERAILVFLRASKGERFTTDEVVTGIEAAKLSKRTVQRHLRDLVIKNLIKVDERYQGFGKRQVHYYVADDRDEVVGKVGKKGAY
jgi:DNA-binding transcriptional ArsR family regulator